MPPAHAPMRVTVRALGGVWRAVRVVWRVACGGGGGVCARRYGVVLDECAKMLIVEPSKLVRAVIDSLGSVDETGARTLSPKQVGSLEGLIPLVRESINPDGTTVERASDDVFFGERYNDEEIPIIDIRKVDEVCCMRRRRRRVWRSAGE